MDTTLDWKAMKSYEIKANKTLHCKIGGFNDFIISKNEKFELNQEHDDFDWMKEIVTALNENEEKVAVGRIKRRFLNLFDDSMGELKSDLELTYRELINCTFNETNGLEKFIETIMTAYDEQIEKFGDRISWTEFSKKMKENLNLINEYKESPAVAQTDKIYLHMNHNHLKTIK